MSGIIYWIDDKPGAFPQNAIKKRLELACDAEIENLQANHGTLDEILNSLDARNDVKLIVLDYWLGNLPRTADPDSFTKTEFGSAWAVTIRAAHSSVPIVGVTSEDLADVPDSQKSQFLRLLNREKIFDGSHDHELKALIEGFPKIYQVWESAKPSALKEPRLPGKVKIDQNIIVSLLRPPQASADYLKIALPEFAKQDWDQETPHQFSNWIIEVLMARPGFLADALELATLLGLSEKGLKMIASHFDKARYIGAFASEDQLLWWVSPIRSITLEIIGKSLSGPLRSHREALLSACNVENNVDYLSKAYASKHLSTIPDCVAFADDQRILSKRVQACSENTVSDPFESPPIGFEARRVWRPVE